MRNALILVLATCFYIAAPPVHAAASKGAEEVATATAHAQMAAAAANIETVHLHLQHVVNCLVGQEGKGYIAGAGDPCKGLGKGALNDVSKSGTEHKKLEQALEEANKGIAESAFAAAQKTAKQLAAELKGLKKD